jgi:peroxiredoxin
MALNANGQAASASIHFPEEITKMNAQVLFNDGLDGIDDIPVKTSSLNISNPFYGRYAEIYVIVDPNNDSEQSFQFYVDDKPSNIVFIRKDGELILDKLNSKNYLSADDLGKPTLEASTEPIYKKMQDFIEKEGDSLNDTLVSNRGVQLAHELSNTTVDFIKTHSTSYFAFQSLKRVAPTNKYTTDSLVSVFKRFPTSFTSSREGTEILEKLTGFSLKTGMDAPNFTMRDIEGNEIDLNVYRGKHVLLNFWASWCVPCLAEMPAVVSIGKSTPKDKLELIFMSSDKDPNAMNRAIERYEMKGVHIVSDKRIIQKYGAQAIPKLYLIDPNGKIIYNRDYDEKSPEKLESLIELIDKVTKRNYKYERSLPPRRRILDKIQ